MASVARPMDVTQQPGLLYSCKQALRHASCHEALSFVHEALSFVVLSPWLGVEVILYYFDGLHRGEWPL